MAPFRRHAGFLLRTCGLLIAAACALSGGTLLAQYPGIGSLQSTPSQSAGPTAVAGQRVLDIRIVGNSNITREKVLANIATRVGEPFDATAFAGDVRKLHGRSWFVHVVPRTEQVAGGVVVTLEVVESPRLQYVLYRGNEKISAKTLGKQTKLKAGDPLDIYAIEEGRRKLEAYYRTKGYNNVKVTIWEGDKPGAKGAVYVIDEGRIARVRSVDFEGNSIATDDRLYRAVIQSKKPLFWVYKGHFDLEKLEEDDVRLENYYRSLGFFNAKISHDFVLNDKEKWADVTFHVDEGPRYVVREVRFIGNDRYEENVFLQQLQLKGGDYFDQTKMSADMGTIKDMYGSNGFVFADAQPELKFYEEPGALDLVYRVSEGQQYAAGEIRVHVTGDNPHTRTYTVLNFVPLRPGDIIDITKIRTGEKKLKASALFNTDPSKGDTPRIVVSAPEDELLDENPRGMAGKSRGGDSVRGQSPDRPYGGQQVGFTYPGPPPAYTARQPAPVSGNPPLLAPTAPPIGAPVYPQQPPPVNFQQPAYTQQPAYGQPPAYAQPPVYGQQPAYAQQPVYAQQPAFGAPPAAAYQPPVADPLWGQGVYAPQPVPQQPVPQQPGYFAPPGGAQPVYPPGVAPEQIYAPMPSYPGNDFLAEPGYEQPLPQLPIDIYVPETQTGRFMFGVGVNSNAGLVGNIVIDERNFDWRRVPYSWEEVRTGRAFRGAGQTFRIEAAPGTQVQRYLFEFGEPFLFDTPVSFGTSGFYFNRVYTDWLEQRLGGRVRLGYQFTPDLSAMMAFRGESIVIVPDQNLPPVPDLEAVDGSNGLYGFSIAAAHDTRDSTFLATEGHLVRLEGEYVFGSYAAGGAFGFPRINFDARQHFLLRQRPDGSGRHVLSFYNTLGVSGEDTPIYERYFAGGFSTLRGFRFRGASPMFLGVEVGGTFQNLSSIEYMFPITADDMLRAVAFVDFGAVEPTANIDIGHWRVAPGIGFRVSIPALGPAPIALDFAVPVAYEATDLREVFSFFVGYSR